MVIIMSDVDFNSQVQATFPVGSAGMSVPKQKFLEHWYNEFGDYYYLAANVGDDADYRIDNACEAMISIVDSIAYQNELRDMYKAYKESVISAYLERTRKRDVSDLSEAEVQYLARDVANRIVGQITAWIGKYFPLHKTQAVGVCRGPPGYDGNAKYEVKASDRPEYNIAEVYARIITGKIELDVSQLTIGFRGSGKSRKDLCLSERVAAWVSYLIDNDPTLKGSKNYFYEDLIAVISNEAAEELMHVKGKYLVKMYDDITAKAWNSRNFGKKANKDANATFMINRIERQCQFFSFPDLFTLDKVPRSMASHLCEMSKSSVQMREQVQHSLGKVFEMDKVFRMDKQIYRLPIFCESVISFVTFPKCTSQTEAWYQEVRERNSKLNSEKSGDEDVKVLKKNRYQMNAETKFRIYEDEILHGCSHKEAANHAGISRHNFNDWSAKGWIPLGDYR